MTRLLALADTQIGVGTVSLQSQRDVLDQAVALALEHEVDLVLHGGDVFEGPVVMPEHLRCFVDATAPLREKKIPLLITLGNGRHDLATRGVHALDILRELPHTQISDRPQGINVRGIAVITLPWVHPGGLLAHLNGQVDHDKANAKASELLVEIAGRIRAQVPDGVPTVLLCHWAISGSKLPTGLPVEDMREPILPWAELDALGFDVIVGAHIHEKQQISDPRVDQTLGIVVGSPQQLNHGEAGEHGVWIVELDASDGEATAEFVALNSPQFITWEFERGDEHMSFDRMPDVAGAYVRVRYKATEEQAKRISHENLISHFRSSGAASIKIEPQIIRTARSRAEGISEQLSQVEALVQWCAANQIDKRTEARLVARLQEWT